MSVKVRHLQARRLCLSGGYESDSLLGMSQPPSLWVQHPEGRKANGQAQAVAMFRRA